MVLPFTVAPRITKYVGENYRNTYGICVLKTTDVPECNQRRAKQMGRHSCLQTGNLSRWSVILPGLVCRVMQFPSKPEPAPCRQTASFKITKAHFQKKIIKWEESLY